MRNRRPNETAKRSARRVPPPRGFERPTSRTHSLAPKIWLAALVIITLSSCERTPSKSDYVSAQVSELCKEQTGDELRACRLAVIKQFMNTPLEEMQRRFPPPEPRSRPSCGL